MLKFTLTTVACFFAAQTAMACMAAPVPVKWYKPKDAAIHYSVELNGQVTVVDAKNNKTVLWKARLKHYSQHTDQVKVVDNGNLIVCIRGNHPVNKLTDVAVEIFMKGGETKTFSASTFIAELQPGTPPGQPRISIAPTYRWMTSIKGVDAKGIEIVNALNEAKSISWN